MSAHSDKQQQDEKEHIAQVVEGLCKHYPDKPADAISKIVDEVYQQFQGQPIRDFVPLLVERRAHELLGGHPTAVPTSLDEEVGPTGDA